MRTEDRWFGWYETTPYAVKALIEKVDSFEPMFDDMLFRSGSTTYETATAKLITGEDLELDLPETLQFFSLSCIRFYVKNLKDGFCGLYNRRTQSLSIDRKSAKDDSVILHEMIHMHEAVIDDLPSFYHDAIIWCLYKDLRGKVPDLDQIIDDHAGILGEVEIARNGGVHDVLFLLKSIDLDIRKGYKIGTVFGYEFLKDFSGYTYRN